MDSATFHSYTKCRTRGQPPHLSCPYPEVANYQNWSQSSQPYRPPILIIQGAHRVAVHSIVCRKNGWLDGWSNPTNHSLMCTHAASSALRMKIQPFPCWHVPYICCLFIHIYLHCGYSFFMWIYAPLNVKGDIMQNPLFPCFTVYNCISGVPPDPLRGPLCQCFVNRRSQEMCL